MGALQQGSVGEEPTRAIGSFGIPGEGTDLGTLRSRALGRSEHSLQVCVPSLGPAGGEAGFGTLRWQGTEQMG